MELSSALCWAQQAHERERASSASLENVRIIAELAAVAWGQQALAAESRERRRIRTRLNAALLDLRKRQREEEQALSENPDRIPAGNDLRASTARTPCQDKETEDGRRYNGSLDGSP